MDLNEREFMHEQERQSPFSPPPERFGTASKVLVFIVVLFLLYKLTDWKLGQRSADPVIPPAPTTGATVSRSAEYAAPSTLQTPRESNPQEAQENIRTVSKCIVDGKTSYGDASCAVGAKATQLVTKENHNLMAAVRVPATPPEDVPAPPQSVITQNEPGVGPAVIKAECNALEERIKYLDSLARQPQSGQTQDWIREERKSARDRQVRIPCR
ncbi:MAG TPA: hypothetical protein VE934_01030 [Polaromonas sp.]|uniref:hypothetical protein n=1 Tax=Polaromonas sp. TaxID=1869339 RepID=UPI002D67F9BC|nr:hypothetical protein [Polaromonas sp.]HYW55517.1 hypothetical protein [Polaromonas sp.]